MVAVTDNSTSAFWKCHLLQYSGWRFNNESYDWLKHIHKKEHSLIKPGPLPGAPGHPIFQRFENNFKPCKSRHVFYTFWKRANGTIICIWTHKPILIWTRDKPNTFERGYTECHESAFSSRWRSILWIVLSDKRVIWVHKEMRKWYTVPENHIRKYNIYCFPFKVKINLTWNIYTEKKHTIQISVLLHH